MAISGRRAIVWCGAIAGALALTACGGGAITTATPLATVTPSAPTQSANIAPAVSPTALLALTPQASAPTAAATPAGADANAPTPTPLVNGLLTPTTRTDTTSATTANTSNTSNSANTSNTANSVSTSTPVPGTPVTGSTSGTRVASTSGTAVAGGAGTASVGSAASGTRAAGTGTTTTTTTMTMTAAGTTTRTTTAASGTTTATTTRDMATPAPNIPARVTAEQFLNAVVKKADISAYLSPTLRAQSGGDGSKLLGLTGSITMFTIDSEKASADGSSAVVHATITTAAGTMGKDFSMKQSGGVWQIDSVS